MKKRKVEKHLAAIRQSFSESIALLRGSLTAAREDLRSVQFRLTELEQRATRPGNDNKWPIK